MKQKINARRGRAPSEVPKPCAEGKLWLRGVEGPIAIARRIPAFNSHRPQKSRRSASCPVRFPPEP